MSGVGWRESSLDDDKEDSIPANGNVSPVKLGGFVIDGHDGKDEGLLLALRMLSPRAYVNIANDGDASGVADGDAGGVAVKQYSVEDNGKVTFELGVETIETVEDDRRGIREVVIPEGAKIIAKEAFSARGTVSNILSSVSFPTTLEEIGDRAFYSNYGNEAIQLSDTKVVSIGTEAFQNSNCKLLYPPTALENIGVGAFGR